MEEFSYDESNNIIRCSGYSLFQEKTTRNTKTIARWKNNRKDAYLGSIMHFIRSLYKNQLQEEGFEVRQLISIVNQEKQRVKGIYNSHTKADTFQLEKNAVIQTNKEMNWPADSVHYYARVLQDPDSLETYSASLSAASLVNTDRDQIKTFFFPNKLFVSYKNMKENKFYQSTINLITPAPIQIEANGNYYPPEELFAKDHWASSEKIVNLLPYEYAIGDNNDEN